MGELDDDPWALCILRVNAYVVASAIRRDLLLRGLLEVLAQRREAVDGLTHLTRIGLVNAAFNYRFFRPNPLSFAGVDQKNTDHGTTLLAQASRNKPA